VFLALLCCVTVFLLSQRRKAHKKAQGLFNSAPLGENAALAQRQQQQMVGTTLFSNPLAATASSIQSGAKGDNQVKDGGGGWTRHSDGTDTWYTDEAGNSSWELPKGVLLGENSWSKVSDGEEHWYVNSNGESAWELPPGATLKTP